MENKTNNERRSHGKPMKIYNNNNSIKLKAKKIVPVFHGCGDQTETLIVVMSRH